MKKNRIFKKVLVWLLTFSSIISMTACGKQEGESVLFGDKGDASGSDVVYVAKSQPVEASDMSFMKVIGDTMYFAVGERQEDTEEYRQTIFGLKLEEKNPEKLPVVLEPNVYVDSIQSDAEGNLLMLLCKREGEGEQYTINYFLSRYAADGTELMSLHVTDLCGNEKSFYIRYMAEDAQGNIYLYGRENEHTWNLDGDESGSIWILDHEGAEKGKIDIDNGIDAMFTLPNGNVAIAYLDNGGKTFLDEIDPTTKKIIKTYSDLPDSCRYFTTGRENTILMTGNNSVYEYDILSETSSELIDLIDCDIDSNNIGGISMLEDNRILVALLDWSTGEPMTELVCLTGEQASEVEQKETIILGTTYLNEDVKQQVLAFNQSSDKYHVEIKEYGDGDRAVGETLLNAEIVAGGGPDLLDLTYISNVDMYISKGVLDDLNPYIDADEEIKREDYVEPVLNAYQEDGKLYCIVPGFMLYTAVGKTSDVGSKPGWTIDDVMALMDSKPEGTELFAYCTRSLALRYFCTMSMDSFVDMETGVCKFNDGYFESVLEFVNRFPKESAKKEGDDDMHTKIQNETVLLEEIAIHSVSVYQMQTQLFGEPVTFIGFPVKEGSGSYIMPNRIFGINSKAKEKDGAWEFLRTFLMEDYQKDEFRMEFPVLKSALNAQFEKAMTPQYSEENGQQVEVAKTSYSYGGWETEIYAATKEQVEELKTLIETTDGVYTYYTEISNIIEEETAPFFEGQKSAKEVADIIQSRVQIYVNENF